LYVLYAFLPVLLNDLAIPNKDLKDDKILKVPLRGSMSSIVSDFHNEFPIAALLLVFFYCILSFKFPCNLLNSEHEAQQGSPK
jgi:hypothetical protein